MGEAEGKGGGRLAEEGDGTLLGLVILEREMDGAGAAIDRDIEEALAPLAIGGLQPGQVLDVDMHEAEVMLFKATLPLAGRSATGLGRRFRPSALRMRQMLSRLRCSRKWQTMKVRSSRAKLVARRRAQATARSSSVAFHGR
jgi:hypothetical protein